MYDERFLWEMIDRGALHRKRLRWMKCLGGSVHCIVVFGCWDTGDVQDTCYEPYVLQRILGASRVVIVDKKAEHIRNARSWFERAQIQYPGIENNCNFEFAIGDMVDENEGLASGSFDLAYCCSVLSHEKDDVERLQGAINTMARVVKAGKWVIADESMDLHLQQRFREAGLEEVNRFEDGSLDVYFYRKPGN